MADTLNPLVINGEEYKFRDGIKMGEWAKGRLLVTQLDDWNLKLTNSVTEKDVVEATEGLGTLWDEFLLLCFDPETAKRLVLDNVTYADMGSIIARFTSAAQALPLKPVAA